MTLEQMIFSLAGLVVILFLYNYTKDKETHRRSRIIATSVSEFERKMYEMEMRLNEKLKQLTENKTGLSAPEIETLIDITASEKLIAVDQNMHALTQEMQRFQEEFASRLINLESGVKEASMPRSSVGGADDQRILQLANDGKDIDTIAKELRISNAEVEFALKLSDLR